MHYPTITGGERPECFAVWLLGPESQGPSVNGNTRQLEAPRKAKHERTDHDLRRKCGVEYLEFETQKNYPPLG